MSVYDEAVATLYQATLGDFVTERKRLASELKAAGDKDAASRFAKLVRPSVSAWVVNQLWWRERGKFDALIAAADRVKAGEREASQLHRQALAELRLAAARSLEEAGNAATDATLRRVTTTLSALAANGGFEPDAPGALGADRDPPGFETLGFGASAGPSVEKTARNSAAGPAEASEKRRAAEAEQRRAEEAERRRAEEAERQRRLAERERLSAQLRDMQQLRDTRQRDVARLRSDLEAAEQGLKESQARLADVEAELISL